MIWLQVIVIEKITKIICLLVSKLTTRREWLLHKSTEKK